MSVDDNHCDDDGGDDKHHGEEHVFPYEGNSTRGGRDELHNDQQEHGQRQQDWDGQRHLLPWRETDTREAGESVTWLIQDHQDLRTRVSRQVEDKAGEKREEHAGNDDVDDEVERQP